MFDLVRGDRTVFARRKEHWDPDLKNCPGFTDRINADVSTMISDNLLCDRQAGEDSQRTISSEGEFAAQHAQGRRCGANVGELLGGSR